MTASKPLTPAMLKGLRWIAKHQPVGAVAIFDDEAPTKLMFKRLVTAGLIAPSFWGTTCGLTVAGRTALHGESVSGERGRE